MTKLLSLGILSLTISACSTQKTTSNTNIQTTETTWSSFYGGADKAYDIQLLKLREEMAPKFKTLSFKDETTGKTMAYNLFIPKNYDAKKSYPLVLFMTDASTVGKGVEAPLKQGYGGFIWAMDETQRENPSFVLVPSFEGPQPATTINGRFLMKEKSQ